KALYRSGKWPSGASARIVISGTIKGSGKYSNATGSMIEVSGVGNYPPIVIEGAPGTGGTLDANLGGNTNPNEKGRVLYIGNNKVTLGNNLVLTGGKTLWGGAVCVGTHGNVSDGDLVLAGAEITGNRGKVGGGVNVYKGRMSMTGGAIRNNSNESGDPGASQGGGIYLEPDTVLDLSGGTIEGNGNANTDNGGGVYLNGRARAVMTGGKIINNNSKESGGGVYTYGEFEMRDGIIKDNNSGKDNDVGVGPFMGKFIHTGGTVGNITVP
ncbi:MAG: hypothetical protein LBH50_05265, partial [Spirochaetaceae bacterium]|nr:hypothetical protein [Spirochaetaceae bacterium]